MNIISTGRERGKYEHVTNKFNGYDKLKMTECGKTGKFRLHAVPVLCQVLIKMEGRKSDRHGGRVEHRSG